MKIQLLTAVTILALSATTAQAGRSNGTDISNNSKNALAIGQTKAGESATKNGKHGGTASAYLNAYGGRAIAGSVVLEGGACACDFDKLKNHSRNAIAVGAATAGSIHINTAMGKRP